MTETQISAQLFIKMVISNWELQTIRTNNLLAKLLDEQLLIPVAPGRNNGAYILGHLAAVNEGMKTLLGFGSRQYEFLDQPFIFTPYNVSAEYPSVAELRAYWNEVSSDLAKHFSEMEPEQWFEKHTSISDENFSKEPHRNKLNIVINRTNHMSYHLGQLIFLTGEVSE